MYCFKTSFQEKGNKETKNTRRRRRLHFPSVLILASLALALCLSSVSSQKLGRKKLCVVSARVSSHFFTLFLFPFLLAFCFLFLMFNQYNILTLHPFFSLSLFNLRFFLSNFFVWSPTDSNSGAFVVCEILFNFCLHILGNHFTRVCECVGVRMVMMCECVRSLVQPSIKSWMINLTILYFASLFLISALRHGKSKHYACFYVFLFMFV